MIVDMEKPQTLSSISHNQSMFVMGVVFFVIFAAGVVAYIAHEEGFESGGQTAALAVLGGVIPLAIIIALGYGFYTAKPVAVVDMLNNATSEQYTGVDDISCPALPQDADKQNSSVVKDKNEQVRIDCSWKYNNETVNGSVIFDLNPDKGDPHATFVANDGGAWCPVEWKADGNCIPVTK